MLRAQRARLAQGVSLRLALGVMGNAIPLGISARIILLGGAMSVAVFVFLVDPAFGEGAALRQKSDRLDAVFPYEDEAGEEPDRDGLLY